MRTGPLILIPRPDQRRARFRGPCCDWGMEWSPVLMVEKGPLYGDPRGDELCVVARGHAVPRDLCATKAMRAQAVSVHVRSRAVIVDEAAVFVHTGFWPINPRTVRQIPTAPLPGQSTRWTTDRRLLKESHVEYVGGIAVTTMVRTAADLLFKDLEHGITGTVALMRAGLSGDEIDEFHGDRFRGYPTGRIRFLTEQLAVTVGPGPASP